MLRGIWISFDLGLNGDYESMYAWLDNYHATECGHNFAFLRYEFENDLLKELKADIAGSIQLKPKNRIYVVYKDDAGKMHGRFLYGKRIQAPWAGYGFVEGEDLPDEP